jgi:transposase-like protein
MKTDDVNDCLSAPPLESDGFRPYDGAAAEYMTDIQARPFPVLGTPSFRMSEQKAVTQNRSPIALPAPGTQRWVVRRKAAIVEAVKVGQLTAEDACRTYSLSAEEFQSWQRLIERHGTRGLRTTRLKEYRAKDES